MYVVKDPHLHKLLKATMEGLTLIYTTKNKLYCGSGGALGQACKVHPLPYPHIKHYL
jgi:hypothetical protein